jgi:hypothetical protein
MELPLRPMSRLTVLAAVPHNLPRVQYIALAMFITLSLRYPFSFSKRQSTRRMLQKLSTESLMDLSFNVYLQDLVLV